MILLEIVLALFLSRILALLLDRVYVPGITSYILTGIILGPSLLGLITDVSPDMLVEFSIILLFFYSGLNVDFKGLRSYFKEAVVTTLSGAGITIALTLGVLSYLGLSPTASLVVAVSIANTATEVVVIMLKYVGGLEDEFKRVLIMASFLDDLIAVGFIAVLRGAILGNYASVMIEVAKLAAFMVSVLGLMYLFVRKLSKYIYPLIINWNYLLIVSSAILFGLVYLALKTSVGEIYGAYVAGLTISLLRLVKDPTLVYNVRVEELVSRMTTVLEFFIVPVFFIFIGAKTDVGSIFTFTTGVVLGLAVTGKFLGASLPWLYRRELKYGGLMGLAMNVRGSLEPAVVLVALERGFISPIIFTAVVSVSLITSALIPLILKVLTQYVEV
ncbi:MAG: cation:proton antiporter [Desulfurococcales archaeon]|nr:cation:proton antiporter [Desulfurococcales archaeon]